MATPRSVPPEMRGAISRIATRVASILRAAIRRIPARADPAYTRIGMST